MDIKKRLDFVNKSVGQEIIEYSASKKKIN